MMNTNSVPALLLLARYGLARFYVEGDAPPSPQRP